MSSITSEFTVGPRHFRNRAEYADWYRIRSAGFGPWYTPPAPRGSPLSNRHVANCQAALFPEFLHELRTSEGRPVGFLSAVPGYWSGDVESLHDFSYIQDTLLVGDAKMLALTTAYLMTRALGARGAFERGARWVRRRRIGEANAVYLIAITIDPAYRGRGLPGLLLSTAKRAARGLGYDYVLAPFRPTAYGAYKAGRKIAHSDALFAQYCAATMANGLPVDPWFRTAVRNGGTLLKAVPRSHVITRSREIFDRVRASYRPDAWYSPVKDVWECGDACTWYVDRARRHVASVEPNCWGVFDLRAEVEQGGSAAA